MSKGNTFENLLLQHIFENADIPNVGDAGGLGGSSTAGNLYVSLHTADPGEAGNQSTSAATYTGYARVAVARTDAAWTITNNSCANANAITFATCTGSASTVTHFGVGIGISGASMLLYSGTCTTLAVSNNIVPEFAAGALVITES